MNTFKTTYIVFHGDFDATFLYLQEKFNSDLNFKLILFSEIEDRASFINSNTCCFLYNAVSLDSAELNEIKLFKREFSNTPVIVIIKEITENINYVLLSLADLILTIEELLNINFQTHLIKAKNYLQKHNCYERNIAIKFDLPFGIDSETIMNLFLQFPDSICFLNSNFEIIFSNIQLTNSFGINKKEFLNKSFFNYIKDAEHIIKEISEQNFEYTSVFLIDFIAREKVYHNIMVSFLKIQISSEKSFIWFVVIHEINTNRFLQGEAAIEVFTDELSHPFIRCDVNGKVLIANEAAKKIFNGFFSPNLSSLSEEIINKDIQEVKNINTGFMCEKKFGNNYFNIYFSPFLYKGYINITAIDITQFKHLEVNLSKNIEFMKLLVQTIPNPIYYKNSAGRYIGCNKAFETLFNKKIHEIIGRNPFDITPKDFAIKDEETDIFIKENKNSLHSEVSFIENGEKKYFSIYKAFFHEDANSIGIVGMIVDMTEFKKKEDIIKKNENQLMLILDNLPLSIIVSDYTSSKIEYINTEAKNLLGYSNDENLIKKCYDLLCRDAAKWSIKNGKNDEKHEAVVQDVNGNSIPVLEYGFKISTFSGDKIISTFISLSEGKLIESKLIMQTYLFEMILKHIPFYVYWKDMNLKYLGCNNSYAQLVGFDSNEKLVGKNDDEINLKDKFISEYSNKDSYIIENDLELCNQKETWKSENGTPTYLLTSRVPLRDASEKVTGVLGVLNDITELQSVYDFATKYAVELEETIKKLHLSQKQLMQADKMASIGQLAAGVAHEINNPVGYIMSNLSALQEYISAIKAILDYNDELCLSVANNNIENAVQVIKKIEDKKQVENMDFILNDLDKLIKESHDGTLRIKNIVQSLKSFARVDESQMKESDLNEGIESTLRIVWNELKYKCEVIKDLKPIPHIMCNPAQINQVFMNILVNASHAIEEKGKIFIKSECEGEYVIVSISDTGCGIPKESLSKIFDPFFTTKPVGVGTGLGLSISYGIIAKHNGTIDVISDVGKGTTFIIKLPIGNKNTQ